MAFQGKLEWFGRCLGAGRRGTRRRKVDQEKREGKAKGLGWRRQRVQQWYWSDAGHELEQLVENG